MAFCSNCGTQYQDGARFCPKCGAASAQPMAPPVYAPPPQPAPYGGYAPPPQAPYPNYAPPPQPMPYANMQAQRRYGSKSKSAAAIIGFFFGPWTWVYTYKRDGGKFWGAFALGILWGIGFAVTQSYGVLLLGYALSGLVWLSAFIGALMRSSDWYNMY